MVTRDERQKQCLSNWLKFNGIATIVACTGFGKTVIALKLISAFTKRNDDASALVVVPTEILKNQWIDKLEEWNLLNNTRVEIINSAIKKEWICDLLVIDEIHLTPSDTFKRIFECVNYKNILGLTGTLERLDGKEEIIKHYAPVCDTITLTEAENNGWVAPHKEYCVLLDVDLTEYNELSKTFNQCFAYFGFSFEDAMKCGTDIKYCRIYAKKLGLDWSQVMGMAQKWNKAMRERKSFVQNHPKKFEIARKILEARPNSKAMTFSATIKQAESFGSGYVVHSKQKKKENAKIIEEFNNASSGVLHSSKACNTGLDLKGVNLEIILNTDSSKIKKVQTVGRAVRFEEGKTSEIFTLIIKGTQEYNWFQNSNTSKVITINEQQLEKVLNGEEIQTREREQVINTKFRF